MITLYFRTVDGSRKKIVAKTLKGAQRSAHHRLGAHPEIGSSYAVSGDGIVTVTVIGCSLNDLFPAPQSDGPTEAERDEDEAQAWRDYDRMIGETLH